METLELLMGGFATALQPENLIYAFIGCLVGTFVGVIPGIGSITGIAILIPVTFYLGLTPAIIMLAAIYYGTMYGGAITSILMNVPGDASSAITCLEGYPMAKSGRGGSALVIAALASFFGGTLAIFGLVLIAAPLATAALNFGPTEQFSLILLAFIMVTGLAGKSVVRALVSAGLGVLIAVIGIDPGFGVYRLTFGQLMLYDGIGIIPVVLGMFGVGELLVNAERKERGLIDAKIPRLVPTWQDIKDSIGPTIRGSGLGFFFGVIPGIGVLVPVFLSYVTEKKLSKHPEKWGTGMVQGVAGPESANNACADGALLPLFTLGLPGSANVALLMGAFMAHGIIPAPGMFQDFPELVWAVIASLYIGNFILLVLNLPLIPLWVKILRIPFSYMFGLILTCIVVGVYAVNYSIADVWFVIFFGALGYVFLKLDFPAAPLIMTLILTKILERSMRRALQISGGDFSIFLREPISAVFLALAVIFIIVLAMTKIRASRRRGDNPGLTVA